MCVCVSFKKWLCKWLVLIFTNLGTNFFMPRLVKPTFEEWVELTSDSWQWLESRCLLKTRTSAMCKEFSSCVFCIG